MLDTSQLEALNVADDEVGVFVSYSHQDAQYMEKESLLGFLSGLKDSGIELWTDKRLVAGEAWDEKIRTHIRESDIALVLVSQAFLDSSYCTNVEISNFLEKRRQDGMVIFPIILSPCEWQRHDWLKTYQVLPGDGQTLEENYTDSGRRKRLFLRIRKELREQAYRIKAQRANVETADRTEPKGRRPRRFGCLLVAATLALLSVAVLLPVEDWLPGTEGTLQTLRGWVRDGFATGRGWLAGGDTSEPSAPPTAHTEAQAAAQEERLKAAEDEGRAVSDQPLGGEELDATETGHPETVEATPQTPPPAVAVSRGELVEPGPGVTPPKLIRYPSPRFPAKARRSSREETEVVVKVLVDENGEVLEAELAGDPQGFGFDREALKVAKSSVYQPATKDGVPVKIWHTLAVKFRRG